MLAFTLVTKADLHFSLQNEYVRSSYIVVKSAFTGLPATGQTGSVAISFGAAGSAANAPRVRVSKQVRMVLVIF